MNRYLIVLSCIFWCLSCREPRGNSEFAIPHELINCFEEIEPTTTFNTNCDDLELDTSTYCELVIIDQELNFSEEDYSWMPGFCCLQGQKIFYENENGDRISLSLEHKFHGFSRVQITDTEACSDPSKRKLYCGDSERVILRYNSSHLPEKLNITLERKIQLLDDQILSGTQVLATLSNQSNQNFFLETILNAYVVPGNLEIDTYFDFDEEVEILGQVFENVYSTSVIQQSVLKIFYNQKAGIVAFIDEAGTIWRIII